MMALVILAAQLAYPIWLGFRGASFAHAAVFAALMALALLIWGPKPHEVVHTPSRWLLALFSTILATALTAAGYGIGRLLA